MIEKILKTLHGAEFNCSVIVGFFILLTSLATGGITIAVHGAGLAVSNGLSQYAPHVRGEGTSPPREITEPARRIPIASSR